MPSLRTDRSGVRVAPRCDASEVQALNVGRGTPGRRLVMHVDTATTKKALLHERQWVTSCLQAVAACQDSTQVTHLARGRYNDLLSRPEWPFTVEARCRRHARLAAIRSAGWSAGCSCPFGNRHLCHSFGSLPRLCLPRTISGSRGAPPPPGGACTSAHGCRRRDRDC